MDFDDYPGLEDALVDAYSLTPSGLNAHNDFLEVMAYGTSAQISAHLARGFYSSQPCRTSNPTRKKYEAPAKRKSIFDKNRTK